MKKIIYSLLFASLIVTSSCAGIKEASSARAEKRAIQSALVNKAIESDSYIIKVEKLYGRGGYIIQTNPSHNYIAVNHDRARINLGYIGRSWGIVKISGINLSGEIVEKRVVAKDNNSIEINMKVKKNSNIFTVNLTIGKDGYCDVGVIHPKIDYTRYRGQITRL